MHKFIVYTIFVIGKRSTIGPLLTSFLLLLVLATVISCCKSSTFIFNDFNSLPLKTWIPINLKAIVDCQMLVASGKKLKAKEKKKN